MTEIPHQRRDVWSVHSTPCRCQTCLYRRLHSPDPQPAAEPAAQPKKQEWQPTLADYHHAVDRCFEAGEKFFKMFEEWQLVFEDRNRLEAEMRKLKAENDKLRAESAEVLGKRYVLVEEERYRNLKEPT